jgi:hypothetical protein
VRGLRDARQETAFRVHSARGRRLGRATVRARIQRGSEGGADRLFAVLNIGGRPASSLLKINPVASIELLLRFMQRTTDPGLIPVYGAQALALLAHAASDGTERWKQSAQAPIATFLRGCWDNASQARTLRTPNLLHALRGTKPSRAEMKAAAEREWVFEAFASMALMLWSAPSEWLRRLRCCVGPTCREPYFRARDPGATRRTCSGRCRKAAHDAEHRAGRRVSPA